MTSYSSRKLQLKPTSKIMTRKKNIIKDLTEMITSMMDQIKIPKSSPENKDYPKAQDPTTVVPATKRATPLELGHY